MKKFLLYIAFFCATSSVAQKRFSEGTITFSVETFVNGEKLPDDATSVQMMKGGHYRIDIISKIGNSSTIYDAREGKGAIFSDFGAQGILIPLNKENWEEKNAKFQKISYAFPDTTKNLLGLMCNKATAILRDSTIMEVYYTKEISPENPDVDAQFGTLPGIALQYTYLRGAIKVTYTATSINFDPVPVQKFDVPTTGYRVMSYEESKKGKRN
jgi:GLPGLI family protein